MRLDRHDQLWILTTTIFYSIEMKVLLARHPLFCSIRTPIFCWGLMLTVYDVARVESIDSFLRGKDLRLVPINKLEQLRKYIFDLVEIERIQFEQVSNKKKENLLELVKLF